MNERNTLLTGDLLATVGKLAARPALFVDRDTTVMEAAREMTIHRVSSILVSGSPPGIVTDRDLRCRVLADSLGPTVRVREVMSCPLQTIDAEATAFEALVRMMELRIHHLPVTDNGTIVGIVTSTDLMRHHLKSPLALLNRSERLVRPESYESYAHELTSMVDVLFRGGLDAARIAQLVSTIHDAVSQRLLRLAEEELGPPPTPYAWIVFGSEGRREQTLLTDQDNAIVMQESSAESKRYFHSLAQRVVQGLNAIGVPPCSGGYMATGWCFSMAEWRQKFQGWIAEPNPKAILEASTFFDFRRIHGELSLGPLREVLLEAQDAKNFLAHMAQHAMSERPPLGFFSRVREDADGVHLKDGGLYPIIHLARLHALEAGSTACGTLERLEAAVEAGNLSRDGADQLAEAFRFLLRLRLGHQLNLAHDGDMEMDKPLHLAELSSMEHRRLKEAFVTVRDMQDAVSSRFATDLLG